MCIQGISQSKHLNEDKWYRSHYNAHGYECGRERCDDFYTTYRRLSALTEIFPEYTFKVILVTEIGIFKLIQWTGKK